MSLHSVFSFLQTVQRERTFRIKGGYIVQIPYSVYFVSDDGAVHRVAKVKEEWRMVEVNDASELAKVGRSVGKLCPELAVVIIPLRRWER